MLQGFIAPVPPVEYQESVDTGACDNEMAHEPLANIRLAKLTGESNTTANHHTRADTQIFHHGIVDGTAVLSKKMSTPRGHASFTEAVISATVL